MRHRIEGNSFFTRELASGANERHNHNHPRLHRFDREEGNARGKESERPEEEGRAVDVMCLRSSDANETCSIPCVVRCRAEKTPMLCEDLR